MEKAFQIQKQARDNAQSFQSYLTDLRNWEYEMKRKEAALNGELEQELPPVRSKVKKEKPLVTPKVPEKRISASDYKAWEKFDVDQALAQVDMADVGPSSLDSKKSEADKKGKLREEAVFEKEKGNKFVKECKWNEAIACYNRAIELIRNDAVYYANRGLCYLKKESFHQAESDCTEALKLDPKYVKAYQRRAVAREKLGSLKAASHDLEEVLKLEPHNSAARQQLRDIKTKIGTKGARFKSQQQKTEAVEAPKPTTSKIVEIDTPKPKALTKADKWKEGVGEDIAIIKPAIKPPHLRSKNPLISIPISEIGLGCEAPTKSKPSAIENKVIDNNNEVIGNKNVKNNVNIKINGCEGPESDKLISDVINGEKCVIDYEKLVAPTTNYQFLTDWKTLKQNPEARFYYINLIEPSKMPSIFENSLQSDTLSDIISTLYEYREKFKHKLIAYLVGISNCKRFGALAMFLTEQDRNLLNDLLVECKNVGITDEEIQKLRVKYEL